MCIKILLIVSKVFIKLYDWRLWKLIIICSSLIFCRNALEEKIRYDGNRCANEKDSRETFSVVEFADGKQLNNGPDMIPLHWDEKREKRGLGKKKTHDQFEKTSFLLCLSFSFAQCKRGLKLSLVNNLSTYKSC